MAPDVLYLNGDDVHRLFLNENKVIIEQVKQAYLTHFSEDNGFPLSAFLKMPNSECNRIIALPAYLGAPFHSVGIKWISSFPANITLGQERAQAVFILNSIENGQVLAVMESSIISAKRTAANAALAATLLVSNSANVSTLGLIGCGLINFETVLFLYDQFETIRNVVIYDIDKTRMAQFKMVLNKKIPEINVHMCEEWDKFEFSMPIISFATSAVQPYIDSLPGLSSDAVILHTSLRDLSAKIILSSYNIVDDRVQACKSNTSVHLASTLRGNDEFINCTLHDLILTSSCEFFLDKMPRIFSPYGMGILDLALAKYLYDRALSSNVGQYLHQFTVTPWFDRYISCNES